LKALYIRAATIDQAGPTTDADGRPMTPMLGMVQLFVESIPTHGLFQERTSESHPLTNNPAVQGVPAGSTIVLPRTDPPRPNDPNIQVDPERVAALMALTDVGSAALRHNAAVRANNPPLSGPNGNGHVNIRRN